MAKASSTLPNAVAHKTYAIAGFFPYYLITSWKMKSVLLLSAGRVIQQRHRQMGTEAHPTTQLFLACGALDTWRECQNVTEVVGSSRMLQQPASGGHPAAF